MDFVNCFLRKPKVFYKKAFYFQKRRVSLPSFILLESITKLIKGNSSRPRNSVEKNI